MGRAWWAIIIAGVVAVAAFVVWSVWTTPAEPPPPPATTTPPQMVTVSRDAYYGKTCASAVSGVEAQVSSYDITVSSTRRSNPNAGVEPGQAYELSENPVPAGTSVTVYCLPEDSGTPSPQG